MIEPNGPASVVASYAMMAFVTSTALFIALALLWFLVKAIVGHLAATWLAKRLARWYRQRKRK